MSRPLAPVHGFFFTGSAGGSGKRVSAPQPHAMSRLLRLARRLPKPANCWRRDATRSILEPSKIPTFGEAADEYIEAKQSEWRNAKHAAQWRMTLTKYAASLRPLPIDAITTERVLGCLKPLWSKRPETASRLRGRIESILSAQIAKGNRSGPNPAAWRGHLDRLLAKRQMLSRGHHAAMPVDDVPGFLVRLSAVPGVSARCLEFTILTAARTGEAIGATWDEIDVERRLWIVPAHRMKAQREHRVPLSDRALVILSEMGRRGKASLCFWAIGRGNRFPTWHFQWCCAAWDKGRDGARFQIGISRLECRAYLIPARAFGNGACARD